MLETLDPKKLVQLIIKEIAHGGIATWQYEKDKGFTHATNNDQWKGRAYLVPKSSGNKLCFGIRIPKNEEDSAIVYGVYFGRFAEMLLSHFDNYFEKLVITSDISDKIDEIV